MITLNLTRRSLFGFGINLTGLAIAGALTLAHVSTAQAQQGATPVEGQQYKKLEQRNPTTAPSNKIEVIEFFWFGCPHCNALDPALEAWLKKAPADVAFKRVHVSFGARTDMHQRLFYTLETLGLTATQSAAVFTAIHADHKKLTSREEILDWAKSRNLDMAKFTATFDDGFTMTRKQTAAAKLQAAYKVDGVPYFAVDGQLITSPTLAGSELGFFNTLDYLVHTVRAKHGNPTPAAESTASKLAPAIKPVIKNIKK